MKVTKRYNQHRRDLTIDMQCENCDALDTYDSAYDDTNFWVNVVPNFECKECHMKSIDMGLKPENTATRYPEGYQV